MIKFFYELPVGAKFMYLGMNYIKTPYAMTGEKGFNAVCLDNTNLEYFWNQQVKLED